MTTELAGRIALITGASRGIGAAVAKRYAGEGAHVILVGRNVGALEEVDDFIQNAGGQATLVPMDITNGEQIDQLGAQIYQRFGRLDILVGNAGMLGSLSPVGHIAPKVWDNVISTNLTANWRLIRSLDPLLKASESGRAMFVTSGVTEGDFPFWGAYTVSKAGLESLVRTYANENMQSQLKVNLIDPGIVRTSMRAAAMPGEDPSTLPHPDEITDIFVTLGKADCKVTGEKFYVKN